MKNKIKKTIAALVALGHSKKDAVKAAVAMYGEKAVLKLTGKVTISNEARVRIEGLIGKVMDEHGRAVIIITHYFNGNGESVIWPRTTKGYNNLTKVAAIARAAKTAKNSAANVAVREPAGVA